MTTIDLTEFVNKHRLPPRYNELVEQWFMPLASDISSHHKKANSPITIGINGAQGSGKSTLTDLLVFVLGQQFNLNAIGLSIDDFYLTKQQRTNLANTIHPLMATRGVPGTHDVTLAIDIINKLTHGDVNIAIPRFNKATDDRYPSEDWDVVTEKIDIVILEGWCVGAQAQPKQLLHNPVNTLESEYDRNANWRSYVNQKLSDDYPALFDMIDRWVMLKAPSFDCVFSWRLEQEHKLRDSLTDKSATMDDSQIAFFIQHYQRITEYILQTLPDRVDYLFNLDQDREIIKSTWKDA